MRKSIYSLVGILVPSLLIISACSPAREVVNQKEIFVASSPVDCVNGEEQQCLLIKENQQDDWSLFYGEIEGFSYKEGYHYKLLVQSKLEENNQQDTPAVRTRLIRILEKQAADLSTAGAIINDAGSGFISWDELQNAVYPAGDSAEELNNTQRSAENMVQLKDGVYTPGAGTSQAQTNINLAPFRVYGDLDGNGVEEAVVVLVEEKPGSKTHNKLIVMRSENGIPSPIGGYPLGSDLFIKDIRVSEGRINVDLLEYADGDPACCPSSKRVLTLVVEDSGLELVSELNVEVTSTPGELESPEKRIDLHSGNTPYRLKRKIGFNAVDRYQLRGLAGQLLDVRVNSPYKTVLLSIVGEEDGEVLQPIEEGMTNWSGELPYTQEYTIRAVSVGGDIEYMLEVNTSGEGGRTVMIPPEPYWIPGEDITANVRQGPGVGFEIIGSLVSGEAIHITGKNLGVTEETRWWQVCCFDGQEGWVRDDQGEVVGSTEGLSVPENTSFGTPEPVNPEASGLLTTDQVIYFTFEDGPTGDAETIQILERLISHQAQGTFFITGQNAAQYKDQVDSIIEKGSTIGNQAPLQHTLTTSARESFFDELDSAAGIIGGNSSLCLRPPYTALDSITRTAAAERGYNVALWDIDSGDWKSADPQEVADAVIEKAFPGARIVMHDQEDSHLVTVEALEILLESLGEMGYQFAPLCR